MPEPKFSLKQEVYWVTTNGADKLMHVGNVGTITKTADKYYYAIRDIFNNSHTVEEEDIKDSREDAATIFNQ